MADPKRFLPLGPLMSTKGSRAFLGVETRPEGPRPVALVWAPDEAVKDSERLGRLRRDTEQAARLDHPNIIQVVAFAELDEGYARVVAFADGESLRRVMDTARAAGRPFSPTLGARVVADACFGVHYAHEMGESEHARPLVHGVLRPEMLMVSFNGTTKVTGYGTRELVPKPKGGVWPHHVYEPPEQVAGGPEAAGVGADVYSLGATLYEVLSGKPPFDNDGELAISILTRAPPRPAAVEGIPEALIDVVMRALSKKAIDRYPSALALREAIVGAFETSPPASEDVGRVMDELFPVNGPERRARRDLLNTVLSKSGMHLIPDAEFEQIPEPAGALAPALAPAPDASAAPAERVVPKPTAPLAQVPVPMAAPSAPPPPGPEAPTQPRVQSVALPRTVTQPDRSATGFPIGRVVIPIVIVLAIAIPIALRARTQREPAPVPVVSARPVEVAPPPPPEPAPAPAPEPEPEPTEAHHPATHAKAESSGPRVGTLEVVAEPAGEVFVDGKAAGRAPVKVVVGAGRHKVRVKDKAKGIDVGRITEVAAGKMVTERIVLEQASMAVTAPAGAIIFLDGRKMGAAPVEPLLFYEGVHRLSVTYNGAKMEKDFSAHAGDKLTFDVQPTE